MKPKVNLTFRYPNKIYNEGEVLKIYKKKFPLIARAYEKAVRTTYCDARRYQRLVAEKAEAFDRLFDKSLKAYQENSHTLKNLIQISIELHKNYAFNFWLVSYAMGEGPLAFHYIKLIEKILKKLYPHDREKFNIAAEAFKKTDFDIFYHKILMTSIDLIDWLDQSASFRKSLAMAKKLLPEKRRVIYNRIISDTRVSKNINVDVKHVFEKHKQNKTVIYNLLDQGLDFYEDNLRLKENLVQTGEAVVQTLNLAKQRLSAEESRKLKNLYLLIKEMIRAKDSVFGRKDIKLFKFWNLLNKNIVEIVREELKIYLKEGEENFLMIPWVLENYLSKDKKELYFHNKKIKR